ncbi:hypothetical protein [Nocardiopsis lucentensis]|uniref:hypothetical protein n=1 Tax=Nocardiopsis lucentensis TaxID=53441 RepID=UPI00035F6F55|nr:hypothetical protein [Nocardiopsis lucentensis]
MRLRDLRPSAAERKRRAAVIARHGTTTVPATAPAPVEPLREPPVKESSTKPTVSATQPRLAVPPINGCFLCDAPEESHGTRYAALQGYHEWIKPTDSQREQRRRAQPPEGDRS